MPTDPRQSSFVCQKGPFLQEQLLLLYLLASSGSQSDFTLVVPQVNCEIQDLSPEGGKGGKEVR